MASQDKESTNRLAGTKRTRNPAERLNKLSDEEMEAAQRLKQEAAAEEHRKVQAQRGVGSHGKL